MKTLSLFDGISVARQAIDMVGIRSDEYLASEIDPYAQAISHKNFPDIRQVGSVLDIDMSSLTGIDLLIGGSPCQDLSIAKRDRAGLSGSKSTLFWKYLEILTATTPIYFILENTASMKEEDSYIITKELGVEPIMINASLVSAQDRKRLFWTNIVGIEQPEDRGTYIKHILDLDIGRKYVNVDQLKIVKSARGVKWDTSGKGYYSQQDRAYSIHEKFPTIPAARTITKSNILFDDGSIGVLSWNELERLQSLPDNYTDLGLGNRIEKRGCAIGNAFNAEVIAHILRAIPNTNF